MNCSESGGFHSEDEDLHREEGTFVRELPRKLSVPVLFSGAVGAESAGDSVGCPDAVVRVDKLQFQYIPCWIEQTNHTVDNIISLIPCLIRFSFI